jgi:two-component system chemotaxis response regulator CheB
MLPESAVGEQSAKYGGYAIRTLIRFLERGAGDLNGAEAMIFGGANVVGAIRSGANIGDGNVAVAKKTLAEFGIPITKEETGGSSGMKIKYQTWDNMVRHRPIERSQFAETSLAREKHFEKNKIRVLVVDDSPIVRRILSKALADEPDIEVVGQARDAFEARELLLEKDPDVITLDIIMPKMDGVTFLKKLMVYYPKPVIVCSTIAKAGGKVRLRAEKIGAVDVIDKETLNLYNGLETVKKILAPKIRQAARRQVAKKDKDDVMNI